MEDICNKGVEHGLRLQFLEAVEQGSEAGKANIPPNVLQSLIQETGKLFNLFT